MKNELSKIKIKDGNINYKCLMGDCPHSCCGPFGGVSQGIDSVHGTDMAEITLTAEDHQRFIQTGNSFRIEFVEALGVYRMKLITEGPLQGQCLSFKEGKCEVHKIKPAICRAYPFYMDMFVGLCGITKCPGFGSDWTPVSELSPEISATQAMYKFWIEQIKLG